MSLYARGIFQRLDKPAGSHGQGAVVFVSKVLGLVDGDQGCGSLGALRVGQDPEGLVHLYQKMVSDSRIDLLVEVDTPLNLLRIENRTVPYHAVVEVGGREADHDRVVWLGLGDSFEFLESVGFQE